MFYKLILTNLTQKIFDKFEEIKTPKSNPFQLQFNTFFEDKILKDSLQNFEPQPKETELSKEFEMPTSISKQFLNPKPEMIKFNIEGFNLNSIHKLTISKENTSKTENFPCLNEKNSKFENNFWREFENLNPKEITFLNFKLIFDKTIKHVITFYRNEIDNSISDYVFNKLSLMEYFNCLRFIIRK